MQFITFIIGLTTLISFVSAECPNACSAHGRCGAFDMCICYRNWMSNDCSERICQFGLAHVDTPKGDLDSSSGALGGPDVNLIPNNDMYPFGTTEQYPATTDIDGIVLTNTAHEYRECSNKGICDRTSGTCQCFEGYDGSACQRASCPSTSDGVCSGHGTCETIQEIAARDFGNIYRLWDEDSTMGCVCDGGYTGADCSERMCKYGADPLYYDDAQNIRYSNWTYQFYTKTQDAVLTGNYSLIFYDAHGEDWQTTALPWNATCEVVTKALEELPNDVIPAGSVRCFKSHKAIDASKPGQEAGVDPIVDTNMYLFSKYTIAFPENPGRLKQIEINKFLDGARPTLFTDETTSTLGWHIYPNGFIGEEIDFVGDRCEDVTVTLRSVGGQTTHYLDGITVAEAKLLKACLGDSDGVSSNNVEVYDWDYGTVSNPHLIKLIDATQDTSIVTTDPNGDTDTDYALSAYPITQLCAVSNASPRTMADYNVDDFGIYYCPNRNPPGFYAVLYYSSSTGFRIFTRAAQDYSETTEFYIYTTKGTLQLVNANAGVFTTSSAYTNAVNVDRHYSNVVSVTNTTGTYDGFYGDMSCETNAVGENGALACINKNDWVMILNTQEEAEGLAANPVYPNIYQVKKISREEQTFKGNPSVPDSEKVRNQIVLDYSMNAQFDWAGGIGTTADTTAQVYKFTPDTSSSTGGYHYVAQCSNRGLCNSATGICDCFPGYTGDNCGEVNALAG
mmetsp:Transcript_34320/g.94605  ORF Transcript_34320/g.94605 Transcript_34320/m.94605 type:complete len:733 (-) Transcript_34320:67-2265(-)